MPRSLFLKIFLWFVAVVLTVIVGTFLVSELMRPEPPPPPEGGQIDQRIMSYAQTAAENYERDGASALSEYIDRIYDESGIRIFLFNSQGQNLSNHRIPDGAPDLALSALNSGEPVSKGFPPLLARRVVSPKGEKYSLVAELPMRKRSGPGLGSGPLLHVLGIGLVGALFCYWLARYLTSPVAKLRTATRELAQGKFNTRVGPAIGKRKDELASLAEDFDLMAEQIESLIESQRRLLGDISHELRSPLARLNVALELAQQRAGDEATGALNRIQKEAENLNEMIGQLLTLTKLESGAEGIRKTEVDLEQLVTNVVEDADFEARGRNRSVRLEVNDRCTVTGTEQLLRRAIENVVRNAVQYTAEGTSVEVQLRLDSAKGAAPQDGKRAVAGESGRCALITVRDHGSGVSAEHLTEIFRPFYRVEDARDRESGGVGLGLAITERAIRLHDGTVEATNAHSDGLIVTIRLPT